MRLLGVLGMLAAAAIVLFLMVLVGRSVAQAGGESPKAKTGSQRAYDQMKGDGDLEDPKEEMRGALRDP